MLIITDDLQVRDGRESLAGVGALAVVCFQGDKPEEVMYRLARSEERVRLERFLKDALRTYRNLRLPHYGRSAPLQT
jgi:hypothetical protein